MKVLTVFIAACLPGGALRALTVEVADGSRPVHGAVVALLDGDRAPLGDRCLTREGRAEIECRAPAATVIVEDVEGERLVEVEGPFEPDGRARIDLAALRLFTITGRFLDPLRRLPQGLRGPEVISPSGGPPRAMHLAIIPERGAWRPLRPFHPDREGRFRLRTNVSIEAIRLEALGTPGQAIHLRREGPWEREARVDLDLGAEDVIVLEVRAVSAGGKAPALSEVEALDTAGEKLLVGSTDLEGRLRIITDRGVGSLGTRVDGQWVRRDGPWTRSAEVTLGLDAARRFRIQGRVLDADGSPAPGLRVHLCDRSGTVFTSTTAGPDGRFHVITDREVTALHATQGRRSAALSGSWTADAEVEVRLAAPALEGQ